ncbi:hypothetical protein QBC37DRAFT_377356 [Rhypophila decipiens]|uniref:Uncharacterized protein n=1 Tax=Rhypophila decipiens TaxID=261697 RepID=A0AAN6Y0S2_9PEZI|nr:hypothetical protein QBC37DRAFT_377356 [Rhypophila decipiens]
MRSQTLIAFFMVGLAAATAVPHASLVKRDDEFDCKGHTLCASAPNLLRNCDSCVNFDIIRNDDLNYGGREQRKARWRPAWKLQGLHPRRRSLPTLWKADLGRLPANSWRSL